jgi:hypothetical protein
VIGGDDFTVRGGSADATIKGKHNQCERMAHDLRLPLIRMVEGSGGGGSVKTIETTGRANVPGVDGWEWVVNNMGAIPRVALGLGSVAGLGAAHLAAAHYSVHGEEPLRAVRRRARRWSSAWARSSRRTSSAAGRSRSGPARSTTRWTPRRRPFARARRFLSYMPSSIDDLPPRGPRDDDPSRRDPWLFEAIPHDPRKPYKMRRIVEAVVDQGSFMEDGAALRALGDHGLRAAGRLAGGGDGERPVLLRRRVAGRYLPQGRALHRHRADVPPAALLPGGLSRAS